MSIPVGLSVWSLYSNKSRLAEKLLRYGIDFSKVQLCVRS